DSAADVRGRDSGRDWQPHRRPRDGQRAAQERPRQMLRRRHQPQAQAARETEGRQEADEARRPRRDSAGSVSGGLEGREQRRMSDAPVKKGIFREYGESLVIAVILALFVRTWVFQAFKIPTGSMENGLLIGDHLIVNKMLFAPT